MIEMPSITTSDLTATDLTGSDFFVGNTAENTIKSYAQFSAKEIFAVEEKENTTTKEIETMSRRIVQVFIADPNINVPLENSLLYQGEQKFTDLTDQELFYEIEIKARLWANSRPRQVSTAMLIACSRGSRWLSASSTKPSTSPPPMSSVTE